jgi:hypothetical protein
LQETDCDLYMIDPDKKVPVWKKLEQALLSDPVCDASKFLSLPK